MSRVLLTTVLQVVSIECLAVTIAMYCIIQFYVQLREPLAEHRPFLKVLAIKLVIFLAFWQTVAISVGTSDRVNLVKPNHVIAYPDIKVGIPALLLCFEMACFAVLHLWAYPYRPYLDGAPKTFYPVPDPDSGLMPRENEHGPREGGFLGLLAIIDAVNIWDVVKAFGRGIRWLFVGVKRRKEDVSYQPAAGYRNRGLDEDVDSLAKKHAATDTSYPMQTYGAAYDSAAASGGPMTATLKRKKTAEYLPIAHEFRRSRFGLPAVPGDPFPQPADERVGLISHAQPNPDSTGRMSAASNSPTATTNTTMTSPHGHYQEQHLAAPLSPESTLASPSYRAVSPYTDGDQRYRIREAPSDATGIASGSRRDTRYDTGGDRSQAGMARVREDDDWEEIGVNSGHQHQPQQQHAQGGTGRGGQRQQQRQNPQQYYERRGYR